MWLVVLRYILLGLLSLMVFGIAMVAGIAMGDYLVADRYVPEPEIVSSVNRQLSKDKFEEGLEARYEGRLEESVEAFQESARLNPEQKGIEYQLARTYLALEKYDEATAAAEASLEKNYEVSNAHAVLAWIAVERAKKQGDITSGKSEVQKQTTLSRIADPLNPMPLYLMAEYLRASGESDAAVPYYTQALERVAEVDNEFITTVKAVLLGQRLNHSAVEPEYQLEKTDGVAAPEDLYMAVADALLRRNRGAAEGYLEQIKKQVPPKLAETLNEDSFFQDYAIDVKVKNTGGIVPPVSSPNE